MPSYDLVGTVKQIGDVQTFASGFTKREVIVSDDDQRFPQDLAFSFARDRARLLDNVAVGDRVKVSFDIRGREYNGRHYTDLSGWRIEKEAAESPAQGLPASGPAPSPYPAAAPAPGGYPPPPHAAAAPAAPAAPADDSLDDLPF